MNAHQQTIALSGMTCGSCVAKIEQRLSELPDVESVTVTLQPPQAVAHVKRNFTSVELNEWLAPLGNYRTAAEAEPLPPPDGITYRPLIILLVYLLTTTACVLIATGAWDASLAMWTFMGGFFIAFSFFKMLDLRGFADAYRSYDLIAKVWPGYGYIYPFIELGLGLAYIANVQPFAVNVITAVVMAVSLAGVLKAVLSKQAIRCACLGTVFNLPMSTVTIIEDGAMLIMALMMLLI